MKERRVEFTPEEMGPFQMFEPPLKGQSYAIGGDPCPGIYGGNPAAAVVLRRTSTPIKVVGLWHGLCLPHEFADILINLGWFYNAAYIGVEANENACVSRIIDAEGGRPRYSRLMYRKSFDKQRMTMGRSVGWYNDSTTKPKMLADLQHVLKCGGIEIPSQLILRELKGWHHDFTKSRPDARTFSLHDGAMTCHGDTTIALGIAVMVHADSACPIDDFVDDDAVEYRNPSHRYFREMEEREFAELEGRGRSKAESFFFD